MEQEGSEKLTTNYLADGQGFRSGPFISTFQTRKPFLALIDRQRTKARQRIEMIAGRLDIDPRTRIRQIIAELHQAFRAHRKPQRRLVQALPGAVAISGLRSPTDTAARAIIKICEETADGRGRSFSEVEIFVLSRSILETLRQAALQSSRFLGTHALEDALERLAAGFLRSYQVMDCCSLFSRSMDKATVFLDRAFVKFRRKRVFPIAGPKTPCKKGVMTPFYLPPAP